MASSATPSRSGKSSRSGILNGTPASLIFALARLRRWPIAAGDTRKAEAIAAASRPRSAGTGPFDDEPHPRLPRQRPLPPRQSRPGLDAAARAADRPALRAVILPASQPDRTAVESDARERHPQQMLRQIPRLCRSRARLPAQNRATAVRRVLVDHHRQFPRHQPEGISDPRVTPLYSHVKMAPDIGSITSDRRSMLPGVLSSLARLDVDPWQEAATLTKMPAQDATARLTSLLSSLPSDAATVVAPSTVIRLIALLPAGAATRPAAA